MKKVLFVIVIAVFCMSCSSKKNFTSYEDRSLYGLHGQLIAQEGKGMELSDILLEAASLLESAEGCYLYAISKDFKMPNAVWVSEIWESKSHHDNSLKSEEVRALIGKAIPILQENPKKGQELKILGGLGIR